MTRLAAGLICLALAGCGAAPAGQLQTVDAGAEFILAPGATASIQAAELRVRFVAVTEDSRCPRDTTCIWAGEVKGRFEIQRGTRKSSAEILEGGNTLAGEYRVTLVRVEPLPTSTARIAPQDYRATLKADKAEMPDARER
jgi:hypothetical protein